MVENRQLAIVSRGASGIGGTMTLGPLEARIDIAAVDRGPARLGGLEAAASGSNIQGARGCDRPRKCFWRDRDISPAEAEKMRRANRLETDCDDADRARLTEREPIDGRTRDRQYGAARLLEHRGGAA